MKKLILCVTLILALLLCGAALADEVSIGSTGITLTLPSGYEEYDLESDEIADGAVGCWVSSRL